MSMKKIKKPSKEEDQILALHIVGRNDQFERNGGGQWVAVNRPHKNKKKYDRKQIKREDKNIFPSFLVLSVIFINFAVGK